MTSMAQFTTRSGGHAPAAVVAQWRSTQSEMDAMVARLREGAPAFARLPIAERITLARSMQTGYLRIAEESVRASCAAKGIPVGTPGEGEEWGSGPWCVVRHLRLVIESLSALERTGNTPVGKTGRTADGRLSVNVFPAGAVDAMLFAGITAEVHMLAGIDEARMQETRASFYKRPTHQGRVALILGAGNVASIAPMDVITKMFNEGAVCLLKMNPVNGYLGPLFEQAFADAIRRNFLAIAYGGGEEGAYLTQHGGIDEIHLTGSDRTYDQIVWGSRGPEREARKARNAPVITKPVTAELGNISPVLMVPGPYDDQELNFQAEAVAGAVTHNASFNCNAAKMLVTPRGWPGRGSFLKAVEAALAAAPNRQAYYPGAEERWQRLTSGRQGVRTVGSAEKGQLPWTLIPGLAAADAAEPAFSTEPFCPILSETEVGSADPIEYLDRAVDIANERLWGTLSATVIVHPKSLKDPRIAEAVERAIIRLRYGGVALNTWPAMIYCYGTPPWGGHPSCTAADIQSGSGWVHNARMLEGIEKAVLRHPLTVRPKPAAFPSHRTAHTLLRRMTFLEERASWSKVPGVLAAAMRG